MRRIVPVLALLVLAPVQTPAPRTVAPRAAVPPPAADPSDAPIRDAATVAVYGDVTDALGQMQATRQTKDEIEARIRTQDQAMATGTGGRAGVPADPATAPPARPVRPGRRP